MFSYLGSNEGAETFRQMVADGSLGVGRVPLQTVAMSCLDNDEVERSLAGLPEPVRNFVLVDAHLEIVGHGWPDNAGDLDALTDPPAVTWLEGLPLSEGRHLVMPGTALPGTYIGQFLGDTPWRLFLVLDRLRPRRIQTVSFVQASTCEEQLRREGACPDVAEDGCACTETKGTFRGLEVVRACECRRGA
jgi:hypothetical protein